MSRLREHFGSVDFCERLLSANAAPDLSDNDLDFLADIEEKFDRWGESMYFSEAQADYLESLAERGEADDEDTEQLKVIDVPRYRRSRAGSV